MVTSSPDDVQQDTVRNTASIEELSCPQIAILFRRDSFRQMKRFILSESSLVSPKCIPRRWSLCVKISRHKRRIRSFPVNHFEILPPHPAFTSHFSPVYIRPRASPDFIVHTTMLDRAIPATGGHIKNTDIRTRYLQKGAKSNKWKALGLLPPGLEPETFASLNIQIEVLVRRSNQLSYGSRPIVENELRFWQPWPQKKSTWCCRITCLAINFHVFTNTILVLNWLQP